MVEVVNPSPTPLERKIAALLNKRTSLGLDYCETLAQDILKLIRREMAASLRQRVQADRENQEVFMPLFEKSDAQAARLEQLEQEVATEKALRAEAQAYAEDREHHALRVARGGAELIAERDELYMALRSIHRLTTVFDCKHGAGRDALCVCCYIRDVLDQVAKDTSFNPAEQAIENCPPRDIRHSRCLHPEACESALGGHCAKCHQALYP